MNYEPHLKRGGELYHYRTKGSRNGYTKDPNYRPKGQKAVGKLVNGKYVYEMQPKKASLASRLNSAKNAAGNWLSDRGKQASKTVSSAKKTAGKVASKVSSSAKKAASNAKEAITGSNAKKTYNYNNWMAKHYGSLGGYETASPEKKQRISNTQRSSQRKADKALDQYNKSLKGKTENAGKAVKKAAKNAENWLGDRSKDVKRSAENVKEFVTGENAKKELDRTTKGFSGLVTGKSGKKRAKEQYGKTLPGMIDNAKKSINDTIKDPNKALDSAKKSASKALSKAGDTVKKAAKSAWDFSKPGGTFDKAAIDTAKKAANNAGKAIDNAADTVKEKSGKAAKAISKAASDSFSNAKKAAGEGAKRAGDFISGLTKKKEKSKSNIKPIETKPIETKPIETKPIETKPKKQKVDAKAFAKFVVESNKNADKSSVSINDKPDGVSDEYWREYKFNGGTRESYDKEMKARSSKNSSKASEYRSNAALARDTGEMHVDNDKKYRAKYNKKTTAQDIIDRNKKRAQFINKSKSYEKAADSIDGMGNKYEYKRVKTSSKAIPYSGYYVPKSENASKSSSKSSNSAKSDYERELEFNSRKNNEFGMGNASENPNFSYYTVDKETGKTVWVDKNGKKHYN